MLASAEAALEPPRVRYRRARPCPGASPRSGRAFGGLDTASARAHSGPPSRALQRWRHMRAWRWLTRQSENLHPRRCRARHPRPPLPSPPSRLTGYCNGLTSLMDEGCVRPQGAREDRCRRRDAGAPSVKRPRRAASGARRRQNLQPRPRWAPSASVNSFTLGAREGSVGDRREPSGGGTRVPRRGQARGSRDT